MLLLPRTTSWPEHKTQRTKHTQKAKEIKAENTGKIKKIQRNYKNLTDEPRAGGRRKKGAGDNAEAGWLAVRPGKSGAREFSGLNWAEICAAVGPLFVATIVCEFAVIVIVCFGSRHEYACGMSTTRSRQATGDSFWQQLHLSAAATLHGVCVLVCVFVCHKLCPFVTESYLHNYNAHETQQMTTTTPASRQRFSLASHRDARARLKLRHDATLTTICGIITRNVQRWAKLRFASVRFAARCHRMLLTN